MKPPPPPPRLLPLLLLLLLLPLLLPLQVSAAPARSATAADEVEAPSRIPVLLIPGDGGNQIEYKLDRERRIPHWFCPRSSGGWKTLWLQVTDLLPGEIDCWSENIRLRYNATTRSFANAQGVETRVPGFNATATVEYLDPGLKKESEYMAQLVRVLTQHGYERGVDLVAAPYDFRLAPVSMTATVARMIGLVEDLSGRNRGAKVALASHSMGSIVTLFILQNQPQAWKDRYIHSWTSFAGIFAGSAVEFKVLASGDNFDIKFVSSRSVVTEQRSYESNFWMLPNPDVWPADLQILESPGGNYSARDVGRFLQDIDYDLGVDIHARTAQITQVNVAPQVPVQLLIGYGVPTPLRFVYTKGDARSWYKHQPTHIDMGSGDGTVNLLSLTAPTARWPGAQKAPIRVRYFTNVSHSEMIRHEGPLLAFLQFLGLLDDDIATDSAVAA